MPYNLVPRLVLWEQLENLKEINILKGASTTVGGGPPPGQDPDSQLPGLESAKPPRAEMATEVGSSL